MKLLINSISFYFKEGVSKSEYSRPPNAKEYLWPDVNQKDKSGKILYQMCRCIIYQNKILSSRTL